MFSVRTLFFATACLTLINPIKGSSQKSFLIQNKNYSGLSLPHESFIAIGMEDCNFDFCNLNTTTFSGATIHKSSFYHASLQQAQFDGTEIVSVDFKKADLTGANLKGALLTRSNFDKAVLFGALLNDTTLDKCTFKNATINKDTLGSPEQLQKLIALGAVYVPNETTESHLFLRLR